MRALPTKTRGSGLPDPLVPPPSLHLDFNVLGFGLFGLGVRLSWGTMCTRVYILLKTIEGKSEKVAQALRFKPGIMMVDLIEGPSDIIVTIEASERKQLAQYLMPTIAAVDSVTEDLHLLVTHDT